MSQFVHAGTLIIGMVDWSNIHLMSCEAHRTFEYQAKMKNGTEQFIQHDVVVNAVIQRLSEVE